MMRPCLRDVCLLFHMMSWMCPGKATGQCHSRPASHYDKVLKGHTFETFRADRPTDCIIKCENEPRCQSYNFVIGEKICELNNRTKEARPEDFVTDPTRIYMKIQYNRVPLGSTPDMPAVFCEEVKASEGDEALCKNWVKPNKSVEAAVVNCYLEAKVYRMTFPTFSSEDYALIENAIKNDLSAFTLCFFLKTIPDVNRAQHFISYAAASSPYGNGIFVGLFIPTIKINIGDNARESINGNVEDVNWHHICVTWDNTDGNYQLYIDGQLTDSGGGLNKGHMIPRGGTVVLGQDQDSMGGGFESHQAFGPGQLTEVNMWSRVLSGSEITAQYQDCQISLGSVFAWSQFKNASYGAVHVYEP